MSGSPRVPMAIIVPLVLLAGCTSAPVEMERGARALDDVALSPVLLSKTWIHETGMLLLINNTSTESTAGWISFRSESKDFEGFFSQRVLLFQDGLVARAGRAGFGVDRSFVELQIGDEELSLGPPMSWIPWSGIMAQDHDFDVTFAPGAQHLVVAGQGPGAWIEVRVHDRYAGHVTANLLQTDAAMAPWLFSHVPGHWDVGLEASTGLGGFVEATASLDLRHSYREVIAFAPAVLGDVRITDPEGGDCRYGLTTFSLAWLTQPLEGQVRVEATVVQDRGPPIVMVSIINVPVPAEYEAPWCRQFGESEPPTARGDAEAAARAG
jgi:hypothetical protein